MRAAAALYRPVLAWALRRRLLTLAGGVGVLATAILLTTRVGAEGREIRIFEVPDDRVNVGATQVTFDSCHVTVLDIIRPLDLPVARF